MSQPNVLHAPWEAEGYYVYDAYSVSVARVGTASRTFEDARQLARLIAAAPELLEALKKIEELTYLEIKLTAEQILDIWKLSQAAIAKATGGAQ